MVKIKKMKLAGREKLVPLDQQIEYEQFAKPKPPEKMRHHKNEDEFFVDSCLSVQILNQPLQQQQALGDETGASSSKVADEIILLGKDNSYVSHSDDIVLVDVEGKDLEYPFVDSCLSIQILNEPLQQQQELEDETGANSSKVADETILLGKDNSYVSHSDDIVLDYVEGKDLECPFVDSCLSVQILNQPLQQQQALGDETGASSSKVADEIILLGKDNSYVSHSDDIVLVDVEGKDLKYPFVDSCLSIQILNEPLQQQQALGDETGASSSKVADEIILLGKDNSYVSHSDDFVLDYVEGKDLECPFVDSCLSIQILNEPLQQQQALGDETGASSSKVADETILLGKDNSYVSHSDDIVLDYVEGKDLECPFVDSCSTKRNLNQALQQQQALGDKTGASSSKVADETILLGKDNTDVPDSDDNVLGDDEWKTYGCPRINEELQKQYDMFMGKYPVKKVDLPSEKLTEKHTEIQTIFSDHKSVQLQDLDPRLKLLYEEVRDILAKYQSGKVPEAFELVPKLRKWEQILYVTDPNGWSAAAVYMATIIFSSNVEEKITQRFYNLVLLPRVRDDISKYERLNYHLYQALKKALLKPVAFMNGILLPLCESGTCTLREGVIVGSIVARNPIPILHSAAAVLKLAEMNYTGSTSIFLMILLDKKYALPYKVIDGVVFHFLKFEKDNRELTVLWHQCLLTFVQRYKGDISSEQKDALLNLLSKHVHHSMTPDIRKELQNAKCRDVGNK